MSRIGKKPVEIPNGVTVSVSADNVITVKGPKGELTQKVDKSIKVDVEGALVKFSKLEDSKQAAAMFGLYRSLVSNMITGISEGYKVALELVGVGYKAACANNVLEFNLGYSHAIYLALPKEVAATAVTDKGKNPIVTLESNDKQLIGQIAAKIRELRKVEPYKGKGVRFVGEKIRKKAGKTAAKK